MGASCAARLVDIVDVVLLVDRDEAALVDAAAQLQAGGPQVRVESMAVDITSADAVERLAARVAELGTLRAVAHAAGISPTMADWTQVVIVDLVATAQLIDALFPFVTDGTAIVCFASMAPLLATGAVEPADSALDDPLDPHLLDRLRDIVGPSIEDSGLAYRVGQARCPPARAREAERIGRRGGRICSVSPGMIDTPMGRQEAAARPTNGMLVDATPLGREGRSEEVAATVAFLLSDDASFINGIDVLVDGGVVAALRSGQAQLPLGSN